MAPMPDRRTARRLPPLPAAAPLLRPARATPTACTWSAAPSRDLLRERRPPDLDFVVDGDGAGARCRSAARWCPTTASGPPRSSSTGSVTTSPAPAGRRYPTRRAAGGRAGRRSPRISGAATSRSTRSRSALGGADAGTAAVASTGALDDLDGAAAAGPARRQLHRRPDPAAATGPLRGPAAFCGRAAHARTGSRGGRTAARWRRSAAPGSAQSCGCWPPSPIRWRPSSAARAGDRRGDGPGSGCADPDLRSPCAGAAPARRRPGGAGARCAARLESRARSCRAA